MYLCTFIFKVQWAVLATLQFKSGSGSCNEIWTLRPFSKAAENTWSCFSLDPFKIPFKILRTLSDIFGKFLLNWYLRKLFFKIKLKKLLQKIDRPKVWQKTFALPDALPLAVVIKVPCSLVLIIYQGKKWLFFMNYSRSLE